MSYCSGPMKSQYPFGLSLSKPAPFDKLRANGLQPKFSISLLLRLFNRLNLRDKKQKMFINVE